MRLTQWFDRDIKPVRKGVYQVGRDKTCYAYWDGEQFGYRWWDYGEGWEITAERAMRDRHMPTVWPKRTSWRGIKK